MMRYLQRYVRIYQGFVVSGAILLFGTVALIFAVLPGIRATRDLYENLNIIKKDSEVLSHKLQLLEGLREDDLRNRLVALLSAVPQDKSVPTIFSSVEGLSRESGVSILDMSIANPGSLATPAAMRQSPVEKKIGASTLPFSLTATGTYDQIRAFVSEVNKVRRFFDVTSFTLTIADAGVTRVSLSLAAYYQPLPTKVGSIEAPVAALSKKEEEVLTKVVEYPDVSQVVSQPLAPNFSGGKRNPFAQ